MNDESLTSIDTLGMPYIVLHAIKTAEELNKQLLKHSDMHHLAALHLYNMPLNDKTYKLISNYKNLKLLDVNNTNLKSDLSFLSAFKKLTRFYAGYTKINDDGLKHVALLTNLNVLNLQYTSITDKGLKHVALLNKLTELNLNSTVITDDGLRYISTLNNLRRLYLDATKITDKGLKYLLKLKHLSTLHISHTKITDKGLKYLYKFKNPPLVCAYASGIMQPYLIHYVQECERRLERYDPK